MSAFCRSRAVIRIHIPYLLDVAEKLAALDRLADADAPYGKIFSVLLAAEDALAVLQNTSVFSPYLKSSYPLNVQLVNHIKSNTQDFEFERIVHVWSIYQIKQSAQQYRIALFAELGSLDSYFVTKKAGFDTSSLLNSGETLFPRELSIKVPEAVFDVREAGRCLAYELPTAAGFHIFRATESVVRSYYRQTTGGKAPPKVRSLGVYLKAFKQSNCGDDKVLAALKQMTDLHRNPLAHPEVALTLDEAVAIVGIAHSVMAAMLPALPEIALTTTSSALAPSP